MGNNKSNNKIVSKIQQNFALGIIDPQNDFFKGGNLVIKDAEQIIGPINKLRFLCYDYMYTFFSQMYHPQKHMSFASTYNEKPFISKNLTLIMNDNTKIVVEQTLWPNYCIQGTEGCQIHKDIIFLKNDKLFKKGTMINVESYSAFGDEYMGHYEDTKLKNWLIKKKITDIVIVGLATDYCVYNTVLDANNCGFVVHLILSCIRGINENSTKIALDHMKTIK
jgi:nicotinamidase/pyrazinamidase